MTEWRTFRRARLDASEMHRVEYEYAGADESATVFLFVHGGPGGGIREQDRELFQGLHAGAVFVDQRGAGRSRPRGELRDNTTDLLIDDFESIRTTLGIDAWHLVGGSWGSTLALAYAVRHPEVIESILVHGVFLCREREMRWFYEGDGAAEIFPDEYERFVAGIEGSSWIDVLSYYRDEFESRSDERVQAAVRRLARWEAVNSYLEITSEKLEETTDPREAWAMARLETHYFLERGFFPYDDYLVRNAERLDSIPMHIVQGRYDTICPPRSAFDLHRAAPGSTLEFVEVASHDGSDPRIRKALRTAISKQCEPGLV